MLRKKVLEKEKDGDSKPSSPSGRLSGRIKSGRLGTAIARTKAVPFKFQFDILVNGVKNVKDSAGFIVVIYERRNLLKGTSPVKVAGKCAALKENISVEATLYRKDDPTGSSTFEEKLAKVAIRMEKPDGKTIGKLHVNLADYARVPSGSVFADLKMSNGSVVSTKIDSRLLASGKKSKKGGDDGSSIASGMSAMTTGSGGLGDDQSDCSFLDESFDSDLEGPRSGGSVTSPTGRKTKKRGLSSLREVTRAGKAAAAAKEDETAKIVAQAKAEGMRSSRRLSDLSSASEVLSKMRPSLSTDIKGDGFNDKLITSLTSERDAIKGKNDKLAAKLRTVDEELDVLYDEIEKAEATLTEMRAKETRQEKGQSRRKGSSDAEDAEVADMEEELAELEEVQEALKEKNDELVAKLTEQVEGPAANVKEESSRRKEERRAERRKKMEKERNALRRKLDRDQRFLKIAEDLRDVKMTLAFTTMEKDQALLEYRQLQLQLGQQPGGSTDRKSVV